MESKKKINVGISKTDIGYFVDLHHTIIAGSYSPVNTALKDYTTDVERLNYVLKPLNLEIVEKKSNPTLSECIKEWEERGWTVDELKQFPVIKIWNLNKEQRVVDNIYVFNKTLKSKLDFDADYETLNLLTKTLKALEEMKDGN